LSEIALQKWNIYPEKIGVMGFSAGGSLSARASTLFNKKTYPPVDNLTVCPADFLHDADLPCLPRSGSNLTLTPELS